MTSTTRPGWGERLLLVGILLLAGALRLAWPSLSEFKRDEAQIVLLAADIVDGQWLSLTGTASSQGLPNPPLANYVYALPLLVWRHPLSAVLFTGLLNVAAVWLCWGVSRRYGGSGAGLVAALLVATSPWLVFFGRKVWQPSLFPFFALLWIASGLRAFAEGRRWALAAHLTLLGALVQLQYGAIILVPVTVLALLLYARRVDWRALLLGLLGAGAVSAPFGLYLWRNRVSVWATLVGVGGQAGRVDAGAAQVWWRLVTGGDIAALAGSAAPDYVRTLPSFVYNVRQAPAEWVLGALTIGALLYALWRWLRYRESPAAQAAGLVAAWALAPLLLFLYHSMPLQLHYFVVAVPVATALSVAWALRSLMGRKSGWLRVLAWGGVTCLGLAQAAIGVALLTFLWANATPGGYGMPIAHPLRAARAARELAQPVIVASPGDDPAYDEWPAVFSAILDRTPYRLVDGAHAALLPAGGGSLLLTEGAEVAADLYAQTGALEAQRLVPARPGEPGFLVARIASDVDLAITPAPDPRLFAHGVELLGYLLEGDLAPGQTVTWTVAWRVARAPVDPRADYHITNQLLDAGGARVAQADGATLPAQAWAVGDRVLQRFELTLSPDAGRGPYSMRVGFYTYPQLLVQWVLDASSKPAADAVVCGPF